MKLRIWWKPNLRHDCTFYAPVESVEEAYKFLCLLGAYDNTLRDGGFVPYFHDDGRLQMFNEKSGKWEKWEAEYGDDHFDDINDFIDCSPDSNDILDFGYAVYNQDETPVTLDEVYPETNAHTN